MSPTVLFSVLAGYLVVLNVIGLFASRKAEKTSSDFFLAGRGVSVFPLIVSTVATTYTCGTMLTSPGMFFAVGSGFLWVATVSFTAMLMMMFGLKIYRLAKARNYITPGDLMSDFYKSRRIHKLVAVVGLLCLLPDMTAQLVALGAVFEALTDGAISFHWGVIVSGGAGLVYMYTGGMRAVIWNTVVQGLFFVGMLVVTAFLATKQAGGWDSVLNNLTTNFQPLLAIPEAGRVGYYEGYLLFVSLFCIPYFWQRMYMAKSAKELAINAMSLPLASLIMFIACWVIGVASLSLFKAGEVAPDALMGTLFRVYWPALGPVLLMAAFSAGLSTICGELMTSSSILTRDLRSFEGDEKTAAAAEFRYGRAVVIVLMVALTALSLFLKGFPVIILILMGVQLGIVMLPALLGIFLWKRASEAAAFWSILIGTCMYMAVHLDAFVFQTGTVAGRGLGAISWGLIGSTVVFVMGSLAAGARVENNREAFAEVLAG